MKRRAVDITNATSTAQTMLNRLSLSNSDPKVADQQSIEDSASRLSDTVNLSGNTSDRNILMLKDSYQEGGFVYAVLAVTDTELDEINNFLVQLRDNAVAILASTPGTAAYDNLVADKQRLEENMSAYVGEKYHSLDFDLQFNMNSSSPVTGFMSLVDIYNDPDTKTDLAGQIAAVEVDFQTIFSQHHQPATCAHCQAAKANNSPNGPLQEHALAATNTTNVTGASASTASSDSQIEAIRMGNTWDLSSGETLSYSYYEGAVAYDPNYNAGTGTPGTPQSVTSKGSGNTAVLDDAFDAWDKTAEFEFEKVTEAGSAVGELRVAYTDRSSGAAAFAYGPSNSTAGGDIYFETEDIDVSGDDFSADGIGTKGYNYFAALHEIGHALGLSHPFDGTSASGSRLSLADDNQRNSVMSYVQLDRNYVLKLDGGGSTAPSYRVYASTPMLVDVKAMEELYGAETTSDGDTTYSFNANPEILMTITDSGGTDTVDLSNQTRSNTINLTAGSLSSIGIYTEADQKAYWLSQGFNVTNIINSLNQQASAANSYYAAHTRSALYTGEDNLAIAHNAEIEHAIGGSAADTITGNNLGNRLTGGGGDDTIDGGTGEDTAVFTGDESDYTINTSGGTTTVVDGTANRDGTDTLTNVEWLQFTSTAAVAGQTRTGTLTASDLSAATLTFDISVDGQAAVSVSVTGQDYTAPGNDLSTFAADIQTAINAALTAAGQSTSVTAAANSPITITSGTTGTSSSVTLSNLSSDMNTALGSLISFSGASAGSNVYYSVAGGYVTTTAPAGTAGPSTGGTTTVGGSGNSGGSSSTGGTGGGTSSVPVVAGTIGAISVETQAGAAEAILVLDRAINQIAAARAKLGSVQSRLQYAIDYTGIQALNTEKAMGRIVDADFAAETAKLVKEQVLSQAAQQAITMANRGMQSTLSLVQ